jgi:hypothetical protein
MQQSVLGGDNVAQVGFEEPDDPARRRGWQLTMRWTVRHPAVNKFSDAGLSMTR